MFYHYSTIVFVKDIQKSRDFYHGVLGLNILEEHPTIIFFERHFVIHDAQAIHNTIFKHESKQHAQNQGTKNFLVYFETDNILKAFEKIQANGNEIIHGIEKQEWGQHVFRFYDYDNHVVEVGEPFDLEILENGSVRDIRFPEQ